MIIVKLMGGLGNQMFQYATGRRLAHVHEADLKIDLSWFGSIMAGDTVRRYELAAFAIEEHVASSEELRRFRKNSLFARFRHILHFATDRHIYEKHYHFDPDILRLPDNVYLEGYWQCPRYFSDIRNILLQEFTMRSGPDHENQVMGARIARTESVSVHVRRGDYVSNQATGNYHGVCSLEYYRTAIEIISASVKQPHFFIFSDDSTWAEENLSWIAPGTVISQNSPDKGYEDMRLLRLCKHHIVANSSFSWWGAWLSEHAGKIVIAPRQWFKDPKIDTSDLVPVTWKRI
jgi:hypothetical protein